MDTLLVVWTVAGVLLLLGLAGGVWTLAGIVTMRRLGSTADDRWRALAATLTQRRTAAEPLLAAAPQAERRRADGAFAALERAVRAGETSAAETEVREALGAIVRTAASRPVGSDARAALAALTALEDQAQQRRHDYNSVARELNARAGRVPTSVWANAVRAPRALVEVDHAGAAG